MAKRQNEARRVNRRASRQPTALKRSAIEQFVRVVLGADGGELRLPLRLPFWREARWRERNEEIYLRAIRRWFQADWFREGSAVEPTSDLPFAPDASATRYGVQHTDPLRLTYWAGGNRWVQAPINARLFATAGAADLAAWRELPDPRDDWRVVAIPMEAL